MRRGGRRDKTHAAVRDGLRDVYGFDNVVDLGDVGGNVPDLIIGVGRSSMNPMPPDPRERGQLGGRGRWIFVEVKSKGGKLTTGQQEFIWRSSGPVLVVETAEEAIAQIQALAGAGA